MGRGYTSTEIKAVTCDLVTCSDALALGHTKGGREMLDIVIEKLPGSP